MENYKFSETHKGGRYYKHPTFFIVGILVLSDFLKSEKISPWIIFIGIIMLPFLFVIIVVSVTNSNTYETAYYEYSKYKAIFDAQESFQETCSKIKSLEKLKKCFKDKISTSREIQRAEENLLAQKQIAKWAFCMLMVATISIVISIIGIVLLYKTLIATQFTLKEAEKTTKATFEAIEIEKLNAETQQSSILRLERPYLFTELRAATLSGEHIPPSIGIQITNQGRTPAILKEIRTRLTSEEKMFSRGLRSDGMPSASRSEKIHRYEVIPPGKYTDTIRIDVEDSQIGHSWIGVRSLSLFFLVIVEYTGPANESYTEKILFSCRDDGRKTTLILENFISSSKIF